MLNNIFVIQFANVEKTKTEINNNNNNYKPWRYGWIMTKF